MAQQFPTMGNRDINYHFGWDATSIQREFYLKDMSKLPDFLDVLLGDPYLNQKPHQHPAPYDTYYCMDVDVKTVHPKAIQGSVYDYSDIKGFLDNLEATSPNGGLVVTATYRPWALEGTVRGIIEEDFDFAASVMSLVSNGYQTDPRLGLHWEYNQTDGKPALVTNLRAITKIVPKIEIMQKRVFCPRLPTPQQMGLIGQVNQGDFNFGIQGTAAGGGVFNPMVFPDSTLLCMGMPAIRRFRWDGKPVFEISIKMAANLFKDTVIMVSPGGGTPSTNPHQYVTWNRLYDIKNSAWGKVTMGKSNVPLYPASDFSLLNNIGQ